MSTGPLDLDVAPGGVVKLPLGTRVDASAPVDTSADLLTPELAERVEALLGEPLALEVGEGQWFARRARELGVGLVDPARARAWIDETVYAGVCHRLQLERARADRAEAQVRELVACAGPETSGEYDQ